MTDGLEEARRRAARALGWTIWAHPPVLGIGIWAAGGPAAGALVLSLGVAALVELGLRGGGGPQARLAVALGLVAQATILTGGLAGHLWQVDSHMLYFAALAGLAAMLDLRALLAGAGLIAVHHLTLNFAVPALVYPGGADFGRTLMHAAIVVAETAALGLMIRGQVALFSAAGRARAAAEAETLRARDADAAARRAEAADGARRRAMLDQVESAFSRMVERGCAGDLSHRIDARFDEPVLSRLADLLNGLFERLEAVFRDTERHLAALADGDLGSEIREARQGRFEDARLRLNSTAAALRGLTDGIALAVRKAGAAADGIERDAAAALDRSANAEAALRGAAGSLREIVESVGVTAARLGEAEGMAAEISDRTASGADAARDAVAAVARIEESSTRIADIVTVIDSIAFQTNLLALNAAVEAARAGEAGKGFAVVASEVRSLAQRSSDAARDIAGLIRDGAGHVADGVQLVKRAGGSLAEISTGTGALAHAIADIAEAGRVQSAGVAQAGGAVADLTATTEAATADARRASDLARHLRGDLADLSDLVDRIARAPNPRRRVA